MKTISKHFAVILYLIFLFLFSFFIPNAKALDLYFGPATYTNGSQTQTFNLNCGDYIRVAPGGTLTFDVNASGDLLDLLYLSAVNLPSNATFPTVQGRVHVQSTFTWTPTAYFTGDIGFTILTYLPPVCFLHFDIPLPVELSSFSSMINRNNVTLVWQTSSENNNSGFEIERSIEEKKGEWKKIGFVQGAGTVSTPQNYSYEDRNLNTGTYKYRLKQIDYNGNFEYYHLSNEAVVGAPGKFSLSQNYPNPFNPNTNLKFGISPARTGGNLGFVSLKVYDVLGNEVATLVHERKTAGLYEVKLDGSDFPSGVYFYKLEVDGNVIDTKRMVLLK